MSQLLTARNRNYLEQGFILIFFHLPKVGQSRYLLSHPSACVGSLVCLCFPVRECMEIASGCLQRGGCVERLLRKHLSKYQLCLI